METTTSPVLSDVAALVDDARITAFGLLVEADRRLQRTFDKSLRDRHAMSAVAFEALLRLARSDDHRMSMSTLADQMVLTSGGITRLVDRLTGDGYVVRLQCESDRRVQWAELTEKGATVLGEAVETHLYDLDHHFTSKITADELPIVTQVLDRLREHE